MNDHGTRFAVVVVVVVAFFTGSVTRRVAHDTADKKREWNLGFARTTPASRGAEQVCFSNQNNYGG